MTSFKRALRTTGINSLFASLLALLGLCSVACMGQTPNSTSNGGLLRVLSVRRMSTDEYKRRVHDDIGAIFSLRLRYDAPSDHSIYVYAPNGSIPIGYTLERSGMKARWLTGLGGGDGSQSPGFKKLEDQSGKGWLLLPAQTALEWEIEVDTTNPGQEEAKSVFVKRSHDAAPEELTSPWFSTAKAETKL
jgi:hypothetical protein